MRQSLILINLSLILLLIVSSCSLVCNCKKTKQTPVIEASNKTERFNIQFDYRKHHFSGILIVREMSKGEIRIIAISHFGLSLFDFGFKDKTFILNSCTEALRSKRILKILEKDFRLLFLEGKNICVHDKNSTFEKRSTGSALNRVVFILSDFNDSKADHIELRHPCLGVSITLDKIK